MQVHRSGYYRYLKKAINLQNKNDEAILLFEVKALHIKSCES